MEENKKATLLTLWISYPEIPKWQGLELSTGKERYTPCSQQPWVGGKRKKERE